MRAAAVVLLLAGLLAWPAQAFEGYEGTRALSMGGATRAWALGDSALLLNPSGMVLAKAYTLEAAYAYGSRLSEQLFHASVVDTTSETGLGGGLYYTYHRDDPAGLPGRGHELGGSLALPLGPSMSLGATLKWLRLEGSDDSPALPATAAASGFTYDVGVTVRPTSTFSLALVGANLADRHSAEAPRMVTYGAAFIPLPQIVLAVDGVTTFTNDAFTGANGTGVRAGGEATLAQRVVARLGGGFDPALGTGYLAGGVAFVSQVASVDIGARGDLFPYRADARRDVVLGVSLRLFVPGAVASAQAQSP